MPDSDRETEDAVRTRMGALRRPLFLPLALLIVVATPLGSSIVLSRVFSVRPDASSLFGLVAGILAAISILGHSPAMYLNSATGQHSLFWSPRTTRSRLAFAGATLALLAIGMAVDCFMR